MTIIIIIIIIIYITIITSIIISNFCDLYSTVTESNGGIILYTIKK